MKKYFCVDGNNDWRIIIYIMLVLSGTFSMFSPYTSSAVNEDYDAAAVESQDRLLIEEISSIKENIDNIKSAFDEGNYTMAIEQVDEIQNGDNWNNVKTAVQERNESNIITKFDNSLLALKELLKAKDPNAVEYVNALSEDYDKIIQVLEKPIIDVQRLILTMSTISIVIVTVLFIIPKFRQVLKIKY